MMASDLLRIGPIACLTDIDGLSEALESHRDLFITFRLYQAGVYRLQGQCRDLALLQAWLEQRLEVAAVTLRDSMLHITPTSEARLDLPSGSDRLTRGGVTDSEGADDLLRIDVASEGILTHYA